MELTLNIKVPRNDRKWRATTGFDQARFWGSWPWFFGRAAKPNLAEVSKHAAAEHRVAAEDAAADHYCFELPGYEEK